MDRNRRIGGVLMLDDNLINEIKKIPIEVLTEMLEPYGIKIKESNKEIYFDEDFRQQLWDEYSTVQFKLDGLKAFVGNPTPLTYKEIENQKNLTCEIQLALTHLMDELEDTYNELAWGKNYLDLE